MCTKVGNLVLCGIALVWFFDEDPLQFETRRNFQSDIIIQISMEQFCEFCWFGILNQLLIMYSI